MRLAGQASRSNKFEGFWAADKKIVSLLDLEGYLGTLALRVTSPSFGNTTVVVAVAMSAACVAVAL
jgi:hypothetical protein